MDVIESLTEFINSVNLKMPITLEIDYSINGSQKQIMNTTLERELAYNIEHAIHHMAILKIGVRTIAPGTDIPDGFGIAVSTLRHRMEQSAHS